MTRTTSSRVFKNRIHLIVGTSVGILTVVLLMVTAAAAPSHKYRDQPSTHNVWYTSEKATVGGGLALSCGACTVHLKTVKPPGNTLYYTSGNNVVDHFHADVVEAWSNCKWYFYSGGFTGLTCYYYH